MSQHTYNKKLIGTSALVVLIGVLVLASATFVEAQFINSGRNIVFDGIVGAVGVSSLTVLTSGTDPIVVEITSKTKFVDGGALSPGDHVKVWAREGSDIIARLIKKVDGPGYGYGTDGDPVLVREAEVVSKTATSLVVESNAGVITFKVTSSTRFVRTNFSYLNVGDEVTVIGQDSGSEFVAQTVIKR